MASEFGEYFDDFQSPFIFLARAKYALRCLSASGSFSNVYRI